MKKKEINLIYTFVVSKLNYDDIIKVQKECPYALNIDLEDDNVDVVSDAILNIIKVLKCDYE